MCVRQDIADVVLHHHRVPLEGSVTQCAQAAGQNGKRLPRTSQLGQTARLHKHTRPSAACFDRNLSCPAMVRCGSGAQHTSRWHAAQTPARQASTQRRVVKCAVSKPSQTAQQSKQVVPDAFVAPEQRADCAQNIFPDFESDTDDPVLFPKRQPGAFPSIRPKTHVARALSAISDSIPGSFSLDTPASPVAEGEVYDPLRDGPLRYLGYANECGCVLVC